MIVVCGGELNIPENRKNWRLQAKEFIPLLVRIYEDIKSNAGQRKGACVLNISWAYSPPHEQRLDSYWATMREYSCLLPCSRRRPQHLVVDANLYLVRLMVLIHQQDCAITIASGNKGLQVPQVDQIPAIFANTEGYPSYPGIDMVAYLDIVNFRQALMVVGAINKNTEIWESSQGGTLVDILAPGAGVDTPALPNGYSTGSGTSFGMFAPRHLGTYSAPRLTTPNWKCQTRV